MISYGVVNIENVNVLADEYSAVGGLFDLSDALVSLDKPAHDEQLFAVRTVAAVIAYSDAPYLSAVNIEIIKAEISERVKCKLGQRIVILVGGNKQAVRWIGADAVMEIDNKGWTFAHMHITAESAQG